MKLNLEKSKYTIGNSSGGGSTILPGTWETDDKDKEFCQRERRVTELKKLLRHIENIIDELKQEENKNETQNNQKRNCKRRRGR